MSEGDIVRVWTSSSSRRSVRPWIELVLPQRLIKVPKTLSGFHVPV